MLASAAQAEPIILTGDYIKIGLNDWGTLGYNGTTSPGILYDGTGTGTFNTAYDYLTPGTPLEGFTVTGSSGTTFSKGNNNSAGYGRGIAGTLTNYSAAAYDGATYDNRAVWTGTVDGVFTITNDYFFNADSQKIDIRTTISALTDLTDLAFARQIDPDAQAATGDSSFTNNFRGTEGVPANDLVYAEALASKYVIGLYTNSSVTHNSAITSWTVDTASYLAGTDIGNGDYTIGLGFDIGALLAGQSIVIDYSYIFGTDISSAVTGPNNIVGTRTIDELLNGDVEPVFAGGTLAFTSTVSAATDLSLLDAGGTIDTQGHDGTLTGTISGTGPLTKTGTGTLTLTGANSYTGGTTVSGGRLVGSTTSLQGDIANDATVEFAQASDGNYASAMSGSGALVKTGAGTLTLTGTNSYTGGTTVSGGRLVGNTTSLQGDIANDATVEFAQASDGSYASAMSGSGALVKTGAGILTLTGANSYTGGTTVSGGRLVGNTTSLQGDIANDATVEFAQASDGNYAGTMSGSGALVKTGSGTLTLTGANSYTGGTTVSGGRLVGNTTSLQGDVANNAAVEFAQASDGSYASAMSGSGALVKTGSGTLTLTGTNSYTGGTTVSGGRLVGSTTSLQGDIANDATVEFAQASDGGYASAMSGSGALVKTGAGILTLTGTNSYTGGTTVSGGRLVGNTTSLQGDVANNAAVEFAQASDGSYAGTMSGSGALVKTGSGTLTLTGPNSYTGGTTVSGGRLVGNTTSLQGDIANDATIEFAQASDGNYASAMSGTGALVKTGSGTLTLTGANSYTGGTTVSGGRLVGNTTSLQGDIANDATVEFAQASDGSYASAMSGSGAFVKTGAGTLTLTGANSYTGGTTVSGGRLVGNTTSLQGDIANNATVEFAQATNGVYAGTMSGNGKLVKTGAGALTLTGPSSYTGGTDLLGGTLVVNGSDAIGTGPVTIGAATLKAGGALSLGHAITLTQASATLDSGGHDVTLSGNLSGAGTLVKAGGGTLTLTGTNSQNGINVAGGVLAFASDAALGKAGSIVTIQEDTTLRTLAGFTIEHEIFVNDTRRAKFDSDGHDIVMAGNITGSGNIEKIGAGTLTLTGSNANVTINVLAGRVIAQSQESIGEGGGNITLHDNGSFTAGANMTVGQTLHVVGTNATFDTGDFDVTLTGEADGNACLIKKGAGRLTLAAASSNSVGACVEQGTLSFNNVFEGNVVVETDGRISGTGTIVGDVQTNGEIAPGNSPGQLTVAGSVVQAAGSTLALDIDGATAGNGAGHHDTLVLTGAGSVYTAGGTIQPILRGITGDATNSFTPQIGQLFQVVTAEGGVQGSFDGLAQPSEGLAANTRFDVIYRANAVLLAVTPGSYAAFAGGSNAVSAGRTLDLLRGPAGVRDTSDAGRLLSGLAGLGGDRLALTLEQLSGSVHADAMDASTEALRAARRGVGTHLDTAAETGSGIWGSINRDHLRVNADRSGQGYSAETYTMLIGADTHASTDLTVGAAFGYGNVKLRTAALGEAKDEHYQGLFYGRWAAHGSYLRGTLAFGIDRYKVKREVALDSVTHQLSARTGGFSHALDVEAGHRFALGGVALTPFAGIAYDRTERDNFRENGDSAVALLFLSDSRNAWQVRGGANLSTSFQSGATVLTPYANVSVTHELESVAARLAPRLNGVAMTVDAASAGKTGVQGGAGLAALVSETVSLNAGYRYRDTSNARQHSVNAGVSFRW